MSDINWGILSTGAIAKAFANGVAESDAGRVVAVASRSQDSADAFADAFDIPTRHPSYDALLADPQVQAVYIATPHPMHARWAIRAAEAGKHVLCEKPLALNQWQAQAMIETARRHGVMLMEAFMYRCHPQTARLVELLNQGVIGQVRMVRAAFGFGGGDPINPTSRLFANELAGGGIMDVGCYPVSMARLIAGAVDGKPFANPTAVKAVGHVGQTQVDEWTAAVLQFDNGMVAQVSTSIRASLDNTVHIVGADGTITLPNPWQGSRGEPSDGLILVHKGGQEQRIEVPVDRNAFSFEAEHAAAAIEAGQQQADPPAMTWDDSLGNLQALDRWRSEVGVAYADEKPRKVQTNIAGRPIRSRARDSDHRMPYADIPGLDKPVSKLMYGALAGRGDFAKVQVMFDHWLEVGGNAFDTAHVYGSDPIFGKWLASRGVRDEVVIVAKGAHTPHCTPEGLTRQLHESLENLQTDHADIYIMHRDNLDVPVGEFVDVLNEHTEAGRMKVFGGSNWSIDRFLEANAYAKNNSKQPMTLLNNNLSLAEMVDPVWPGCIHVSDPDSRRRLAEHQVVHLSWSSQARGFFTDRSGPDRQADKEMVRCWYSDANFARKQRAIELARKYNVKPINIAAAWVLGQPFPSFALIGPETVWEMDDCLNGLDVQLCRDEIDWLWSG